MNRGIHFFGPPTPAMEDAVDRSIRNWEHLADGRPSDFLSPHPNAPLCGVYWKQRCDFCPVALFSGSTSCGDTPETDLSSTFLSKEENALRMADFLARALDHIRDLTEDDR